MEIKDSVKELNEFIKLKLNEIIRLIECENCGDDFTESLKLGSVEQELSSLNRHIEQEKGRIAKLIQGETSDECDGAEDFLFEKAVAFAVSKGEISISMLQFEFSVGYSRAASIIEATEKLGYISQHGRTRQVLIRQEDLK